MSEQNEFNKSYSDDGFWGKVKDYAKAAGETVLEPAAQLYYAFNDGDTPTWAKTTIVGALGYFISPIDAIPDLIPVVGYSDDLGVLVAAVAATAMHIKEEHKQQANDLISRFFSWNVGIKKVVFYYGFIYC